MAVPAPERAARSVKRRFICSLLLLALLASCSGQAAHPSAPTAGSDVIIDAASLAPDTPRFFTYRFQGKNINFFVVRYEGKVLSFLDACVTCYRSKQGYRVREGGLVCRDCGKAYTLPEVETGLGGCFPIKIKGILKEGKYHIPRAALEQAAAVF
ncbi:MAG: Fe-S-containing protein [Thermodesulfovibrionales bacterium]